jgi:lipid-binding SYLF domain-containing protein
MPRSLLALLALGAAALALPGAAHAQTQQQALVDRATLSLQELMTSPNSADPAGLLKQARAVMICPRVFKAGFIIGGEGGVCALVARDGAGSWSAPAFYDMGSGSFGLQIGVQDSSIVMMILTDRGLGAVIDDQFKLGANADIAIATIGAGVGGATTAALRADIVAFSISRGLFGGVSLQGSVMSTDTDWDQAYYGQPFAARQIVLQMQANNPGADPLRAMLSRYGSPAPVTASAAPPPGGYAPPRSYAAPPPYAAGPVGAPTPLVPVQQHPLPPPR